MPFLSIDVESAATGIGHNDRAPCKVACVAYDQDTDEYQILMNETIAVPDMVSPLTELTGLTAEDIAQGIPFEEARSQLLSFLGEDVTLVGQRIQGDIDWMQLEQGLHYKDTVDLAEEFKVYNPRFGNFMYFSLRKLVYALFDKKDIQDGAHDPAVDAKYSLKLHRSYIKTGKVNDIKQKLAQMTYKKRFPPQMMGGIDHAIDGVCMFGFNPGKCFCGQASKRDT